MIHTCNMSSTALCQTSTGLIEMLTSACYQMEQHLHKASHGSLFLFLFHESSGSALATRVAHCCKLEDLGGAVALARDSVGPCTPKRAAEELHSACYIHHYGQLPSHRQPAAPMIPGLGQQVPKTI